MAIIRPSVDLRNKYKEISELCKLTQEPMVNLMQKINEGIADVNAGRTMSLEEAKNKLL